MVSLDFFWLRGIFVNYTKFVIRIWWWSISWTWDAERNPLNSEVLRSPSLHRGHRKRAQRKDMKTPRRIRKYFVKFWEILEFLVGNFGHHAGGFWEIIDDFFIPFFGKMLFSLRILCRRVAINWKGRRFKWCFNLDKNRVAFFCGNMLLMVQNSGDASHLGWCE